MKRAPWQCPDCRTWMAWWVRDHRCASNLPATFHATDREEPPPPPPTLCHKCGQPADKPVVQVGVMQATLKDEEPPTFGFTPRRDLR